MPTYTNPKTGKKIKSAKPLSQEQLEEAFSLTGGTDTPPPKEENSIVQDVLEGAGLDPLAHPDTIPDVLKGMGKFFINGMGNPMATYNAISEGAKNIYDEGVNRFGRYFEDVGKSDSGVENALLAGQAAMAPIPFFGNAMENADRAVSFGDPHAGGRLAGNAIAAVSPKLPSAGAEIAASKPAQFAMAGVDRFSPMMSAAFKSPLGTGLATGVGSYMLGSNPSTALYHGAMAGLGREGVGRLGSIMGGVKGFRTAAREAKAAKLATEGELANMAAERSNVPIPKNNLPPLEEDVLDRALKYERGKKAGTPSKLDDIEDFVLEEPKKVPHEGQTPPNPPSTLAPLDPTPQKAPPTVDIPASEPPIDKELLKKYVSEQEADQMLATIEDRKWLPETHEEWKAVNKLEEAGLDRMEAMKIVRAKKLEDAKAAGTPLNSREGGTNPRSLGTSTRDRKVNPRALENRRKEL